MTDCLKVLISLRNVHSVRRGIHVTNSMNRNGHLEHWQCSKGKKRDEQTISCVRNEGKKHEEKDSVVVTLISSLLSMCRSPPLNSFNSAVL
jgi:hypothetical protein